MCLKGRAHYTSNTIFLKIESIIFTCKTWIIKKSIKVIPLWISNLRDIVTGMPVFFYT